MVPVCARGRRIWISQIRTIKPTIARRTLPHGAGIGKRLITQKMTETIIATIRIVMSKEIMNFTSSLR